MAQPVVDEGRRLAQAVEPHVAPALAHDLGVGGPAVPPQHRRRPLEHVGGDAAAVVVNVVGIAVVGGAEGDDRPERRRTVRGDLKRVEPAPRDADHADLAGAPRLLGDPRDDLARVGLLLREVLVLEDAVRLARPALVDTDAGVSVAGEVGEVVRVAHRRAVVQAVGQVLEDRRHRVLLGVLGQPDPRGEPAAVGQLDPGRRDRPHGPREVGDDAHRAI